MSTRRPDRSSLFVRLNEASVRLWNESALYADALAATLGVNRTDLACLNALRLEGPVPAGRLAEVVGLSSGGISGVLDRLEQHGFVERGPDPDDRRRVIVRLAPDPPRDFETLVGGFRAEAIYGEYDDAELDLLLRHAEQQLAAVREGTLRLREERGAAADVEGERVFSSPRDGRDAATLHLVGGGHDLRIDAGDSGMAELFVARFSDGGVQATTVGADVTVRSRPRILGGPARGSVMLNPEVRWAVRVRGGKARVEADLRALAVTRVDVSGGAGDAEFRFGSPDGRVPVHVDGGARRLRIERPVDTPARVSVRGRLSRLRADGEDLGTVSGRGPQWVSPDFGDTGPCYEVFVNGGAVTLDITR